MVDHIDRLTSLDDAHERELSKLQTDIVNERLQELLDTIRSIKQKIEGDNIPKNRQAVVKEGKLNIRIFQHVRDQQVRYAWAEGIAVDQLTFNSSGEAMLLVAIEGKNYKMKITKFHDVGTMHLEEVGVDTTSQQPGLVGGEQALDTLPKTQNTIDTAEDATDTIKRKGDLPAGATVRMQGSVVIVEDSAGHEIGMFDATGWDITLPGSSYYGVFNGNIAYPAVYDMRVTNQGGEIQFEFEKRPADETPLRTTIEGPGVPNGKQRELFFTPKGVGILEKNPAGRDVLISFLGELPFDELHKKDPYEKKLILPQGDFLLRIYYFEGELYADIHNLGTTSYVQPEQKKPDVTSKSPIAEGEKKPSVIPSSTLELDKGGYPDEVIKQLPYGVVKEFGENGKEFYGYDETIRTIADSTKVDEYYVDYHRQFELERSFTIRIRQISRIRNPLTGKEETFPNMPDLNRDDEIIRLDIDRHALERDGTLSYVDAEGDTWTVKIEIDEDGIMRVFVDIPEQQKIVRKEHEEQIAQDTVLKFPDWITFPEFDLPKINTQEQWDALKKKAKDLMDHLYEAPEPLVAPSDIVRLNPDQTIKIENGEKEIVAFSEVLFGLPPYSTQELAAIKVQRLPGKGFKLRHITSYFDLKRDKDLIEFSLPTSYQIGTIIEKEGWKIKVEVDEQGVMYVSAAPPANDDAVIDAKEIESKGYGLLRPVSDKRISSQFGWRKGRPHNGIDIPVSTGTPIRAPYDGVVLFVDEYTGYGQTVVLEHNIKGKRYRTIYAHLHPSSVARLRPGQTIRQGEEFAKSGGAKGAPGSGNSRNDHLHLEIRVYDKTYTKGAWKFWKPVDPLDYFNQTTTVGPSSTSSNDTPSSNQSSGDESQQNPDQSEFQERPYKNVDITLPTTLSALPYRRGEKQENRKLKKLTPAIKNFADNDLAKVPFGWYANFEGGKFWIYDKEDPIYNISQYMGKFMPFKYVENGGVVESQVVRAMIKGQPYNIKFIVLNFGTCAVLMEKI